MGGGSTYSLLGELTGTLVLAVAEQLDDSALVGGKTEGNMLAKCSTRKYESPIDDNPNMTLPVPR